MLGTKKESSRNFLMRKWKSKLTNVLVSVIAIPEVKPGSELGCKENGCVFKLM